MLVSIRRSLSSSRATLFALVFFITICNVLHEVKSGRSLSVQSETRHKRASSIFNFPAEGEEEFLAERFKDSSLRKKRDVSNDSKIKISVSKLKDSKTQLVFFWAGKDVILCLARDTNANAPSTLYISNDYGEKFNDVSNLLLANIKGKGAIQPVLEKFVNHPKNNGLFAFSDIKNKLIYTTNDYGVTFKFSSVSFVPDQILFDPSSDKNLLAFEESTNEKQLWVSQDFGQNWKKVQTYVRSVSWDETLPGKIYAEREEPDQSVTLLSSNSMFLSNDTVVIENGIDEFQVKDKYLFVTKKTNDTVKLFISYNRGKFQPAIFPNKLVGAKHFHVADVSSDGQIFICAVHNDTITNLYIGNEPLNSDESPKFSLSLERIVFFKANLTWPDSWLNDVTTEPFVDLFRVEGLRGVYIASQAQPSTSKTKKFDFDQVISLITYDQGGEWQLLKGPEVDDEGDPIYCRLTEKMGIGHNCSLHISQRLSELYPMKRAVPVISKSSAVGMVMATGTVDVSMRGHLGVFLSTDGAVSWKQVLKGNYLYSFGDHGGIIMAVNYYKPGLQTNELYYSTDEGETWKTFQFYNDKIKVLGLMTEPGENSTVFTIFGSQFATPNANHSWVLIKVDFKDVFERKCKPQDYKLWSPWNERPSRTRTCLMGRTDVYERRIPSANCYNGVEFEHLVKSNNCTCKRIDFECDFGFKEDPTDVNKCIRDTSEDSEGVKPEWCKPGVLFFDKTQGYRKVPGDTCEKGLEDLYLPRTLACAIRNETEFAIVAKRDSVLRIDLNDFNLVETLPVLNIGSAVAIDFDKTTETLYWSDVNKDHIKRIRLDGTSNAEVIISYGLKSVEGLAFDWIARNLYFADDDSPNSKIEVIKTDAKVWGRMRRKILDYRYVDKPRGIAVHPEKGYLFWTDWSSETPCIGRSGLDGSKPEKIVTNIGRASEVIHWPNGIAVDTKSHRLYWVDANLDHLVTSDLDGKQLQFFLNKDHKMSHPFSVAVMNNYVYWDDWKTKSIYMGSKDNLNSSTIVTVQSNISRPMELKVFGPSSQVGRNPCSDNSCDHLCLYRPNGTVICACPDGLLPTSGSGNSCVCPDGKTPNATGECDSVCAAENSFKCADSGFCIPNNWQCDGDNDCPDGSDEYNCEKNKCNDSVQFQCKSDGRCIPNIWRCDLDEDCPDGSDEQGCGGVTPKCDETTQFQCANKRCILKKWVCDGDDDCLDGIPSDEVNCKNANSSTCGPLEFRCPGEDRCISEEWRCDGDKDCKDGFDEENCANGTCPDWKFQCKSGECIMKTWACDLDPDCPDGSDEENCHYNTTTTPTPVNPFRTNCNGSQMFECNLTKTCIPVFWKCDGVCDCGSDQDCSDEEDCGDEKPLVPIIPNPTPSSTCPDQKFKCKSGLCIPRKKICDGHDDCPDKDDEALELCLHVDAGCAENSVQCGTSSMCIAKEKVCDGTPDCPNKWDEDPKRCTANTWISPSADAIVVTKPGAWAIAIVIVVVIAVLVGTLGVFVVRHRRLRLSFFNFASSHYNTSSGAATFQQSMEEEHDAPIIRGFSDDEPLLVA